MFKLLDRDAIVPTRATAGSAGFDLYALHDCFVDERDVVIISTGVAIEIPAGHYAMVCSRSGLAAKQGLFVLNAPGIIDSDYKDEIKVIIANFTHGYTEIKKGDRIAQLVFAQCDTSILPPVTADAIRLGGLGSTGR